MRLYKTYSSVIQEHFFERHKVAEGQKHLEDFAFKFIFAIPKKSIVSVKFQILCLLITSW